MFKPPNRSRFSARWREKYCDSADSGDSNALACAAMPSLSFISSGAQRISPAIMHIGGMASLSKEKEAIPENGRVFGLYVPVLFLKGLIILSFLPML